MAESAEFHNYKKIARGAGFVLIGMLASKLLTYAYLLLLARTGAQNYGLFSLVFAITGVAITLSVLGLNNGVLRYVAFYHGLQDKRRVKGAITTALKLSAAISLVAAGAMFFLSDWLAAALFHAPGLSLLIKIFALAVPFSSANRIFWAAMEAFQKVEYEVYSRHIFENAAKLILTGAMIYFGHLFTGVGLAYVAASVMAFLLSFYLVENIFPILRTHIKSAPFYRELMSFSWPLILTSVFSLALSWTDTLMIGYFVTARDVGIYNAALPTSSMMLVFPSALTALFIPLMTVAFAKKSFVAAKKIYQRTVKWILLANLPIFLIGAIFPSDIISFLFGKEYVTAAASFVVLLLGYFVYSALIPAMSILQVVKQTRLVFLNSLVAAISNVLLNALLIPRYGIIGGAIGTATAFSLYGILGLARAERHIRAKIFVSDNLKIALSAALASAVAYLLGAYIVFAGAFLKLAAMSLVFFAVYLPAILITGALDREDADVAGAILKKLFKRRV